MKHLNRERLLELGLSARLTPTAEEQAHLAACPTCARELRLERELTLSIEALPQREPPSDFVATTSARFEAELARRRLRFTAATLLVALGVGLAAAAGLVLAVVSNAAAIIHGLVVTLDEVVVVGRAVVTVMAALPAVPVTLTIVACLFALSIFAGVGRLAVAAAEAK